MSYHPIHGTKSAALIDCILALPEGQDIDRNALSAATGVPAGNMEALLRAAVRNGVVQQVLHSDKRVRYSRGKNASETVLHHARAQAPGQSISLPGSSTARRPEDMPQQARVAVALPGFKQRKKAQPATGHGLGHFPIRNKTPKFTDGGGWTHDPRFQCAPDEKVPPVFSGRPLGEYPDAPGWSAGYLA